MKRKSEIELNPLWDDLLFAAAVMMICLSVTWIVAGIMVINDITTKNNTVQTQTTKEQK